MRLWHKDLIPVLPIAQLKGEWSELSAIAGNLLLKGTPNHLLVDRVLEYQLSHFISYGDLIYHERLKRGLKASMSVRNKIYSVYDTDSKVTYEELFSEWHTDRYLRQCYYNLQEKYDCGGISQEEWEKIESACERIL